MATASVWASLNPVARSASTDTGFDGAISSLRYVSGGSPSSSQSASKTGCMAGGTSAWVRLNVPTTRPRIACLMASTTSSMWTR